MPEKKKLNEEKLEKVSGGILLTIMHCSKCGCERTWTGGEYVGQTYDCPVCREHTFTGINVVEPKSGFGVVQDMTSLFNK